MLVEEVGIKDLKLNALKSHNSAEKGEFMIEERYIHTFDNQICNSQLILPISILKLLVYCTRKALHGLQEKSSSSGHL